MLVLQKERKADLLFIDIRRKCCSTNLLFHFLVLFAVGGDELSEIARS